MMLELLYPYLNKRGESNSRGILVGSIHVPTSCVLPSSIDQNTSQGEVRYDNNDNIDNDNSCHRDIQNTLPSQNIESVMHEDPNIIPESPDPIAPSSTLKQGENQSFTQSSSQNDLPIALRKPNRSSNFATRLKDYVGYKHDIANFLSYKNCGPSFQSFIASLDSTSIPTNWKMAKDDPKWKEAMLEEMKALE